MTKTRSIYLVLIFAIANIFFTVSARSQSALDEASQLEQQGRLNEALAAYQNNLKQNPKDPRALNSLAGLYGKLEDFNSEIAYASKAIEQDAKFYQAYINRGSAKASIGSIESAQKDFEKAHELAPQSPLPIYSLGLLAEQRGNLEHAAVQYQTCLKLDSKYENCRFNLGVVFARQRKLTEAKRELEILLESNPKAEDAQRMLRQIKLDLKKRK